MRTIIECDGLAEFKKALARAKKNRNFVFSEIVVRIERDWRTRDQYTVEMTGFFVARHYWEMGSLSVKCLFGSHWRLPSQRAQMAEMYLTQVIKRKLMKVSLIIETESDNEYAISPTAEWLGYWKEDRLSFAKTIDSTGKLC